MSEQNQAPLIILTASMSGTAEFVAEEVANRLTEQNIVNRIVPMQKAALAMFATRKRFLIVSSTYGSGDVPDNARPFYEALINERPDLSDVSFGIIGLGDMTYSETFCGGSGRFEAIFNELGAKQLGGRMKHDSKAGGYPEDMALEWLDDWVPLYQANLALHEGDRVL